MRGLNMHKMYRRQWTEGKKTIFLINSDSYHSAFQLKPVPGGMAVDMIFNQVVFVPEWR